jgi:hypothetical protein
VARYGGIARAVRRRALFALTLRHEACRKETLTPSSGTDTIDLSNAPQLVKTQDRSDQADPIVQDKVEGDGQ